MQKKFQLLVMQLSTLKRILKKKSQLGTFLSINES